MRSEREKGGTPTPGDSKGHSPWRFFGDFLIGEKVTRGEGAERPPLGWSAEEGKALLAPPFPAELREKISL